MAELTLPDRDKNQVPISKLTDQQLAYWAGRIPKDLERDPDSKYAVANTKKLEAVQEEQAKRRRGESKAPSQQSNGGQQRTPPAEATKAIDLYSSAHDDAKKATEALARIQEVGHLISPAPACATLPEGCAILISAITVDAASETYGVPGGKKGLSKTALQKLAAALGVSWDHHASGRLDDGRDPYYVEFLAVGRVRNFDGTWRDIEGRKVMDLRNGSPTVQALQQRSEGKASRENKDVADWEAQLRDLRYFILEHAETKAQLRAIRSLGLRTSYTGDELSKPFFAAQIQFTGRSEDPEVRRMFAERIAESFMGQAVPALYGRTQQPARRPVPPRSAPPVGLEDDDPIDTHGEVVDDPYGPDGVPYDYEPERDPENPENY